MSARETEQPAGVCGRCGGSGIIQRHPFITRCGCGAAAADCGERGPQAGPRSRAAHGSATVDALIADLESRGLGWSLDNTGRLIEARVWDWPYVIGRYRPNATEPLAKMLAEAMYQVDWTCYPVKSPNDPKLSDRRGWRDRCVAGGKAAVEAAGVTAAPVRCSAWLAVRSDSVETWKKSLKKPGYRENAWNEAAPEHGAGDAEHGAGDAEYGAENAEHGAENAERGAEDAERGAEDAERGAEDAERGAENAERGAENAERGAGDAERGAKNAEQDANPASRSEVWASFMEDALERLTTPSSATGAAGATAAWWAERRRRKQRA